MKVNHFSPYTDQQRWKRELALMREMGFKGVRTGWALDKLVNPRGEFTTPDSKPGNNWGRSLVKDSLQRYADAGLTVHITLNMELVNGAARQSSVDAQKFILEETAKRFKPAGAVFSLENEPASFIARADDIRLKDHLADMQALFKNSGYVLCSPCQHGWGVWPKYEKWNMGRELKEQIDRTLWNYHGGKHSWMKHMPAALNLYSPNDRYDVGFYAVEKLRCQAEIIGQPLYVTECGVIRTAPISDYLYGQKTGIVARELKESGLLADVPAVYALVEDPEHEFMSADGRRYESRINGWKRALNI